MQIAVNVNVLKPAIDVVKDAIPSKSPLPILQGVLIEAKNNEIILSASDLEIFITSKAHGTVKEEGSVVLPNNFIKLIKKLPGDSIIQIEAAGGNATVKYGNSEVTLNGYNGEEFPLVPEIEGKEYIFNVEDKVTFACSTDESRPVFRGVLVDLDNGHLVATDIYRLVVNNIEPLEGGGQAVIPGHFMKLLSPGVKLVISENQTKAINGDTTYFTRNIAGKYPDWKNVIPKEFIAKVKFNIDELKGALERADLLSDQRNKNVVLSIKDGSIEVKKHSELGKLNETIKCELDGEPIDVGFNIKYLLDGLKYVEGDECKFKLSGYNKPAVMKGQDDNWMYVVVPAIMN